jgi:hypothetical protein
MIERLLTPFRVGLVVVSTEKEQTDKGHTTDTLSDMSSAGTLYFVLIFSMYSRTMVVCCISYGMPRPDHPQSQAQFLVRTVCT